MAAERREGTKGNNENDSNEGNNLQRQKRDVKLIAHELQRGVCENEIQEKFGEFTQTLDILK